jgi:acyl carrier protein
MNNESKIKAIIADMFDVKTSLVSPDSGFLKGDIEKWDSLGHLLFVLKIEEELQIKFSMQEIQVMRDFRSILELVNSKLD